MDGGVTHCCDDHQAPCELVDVSYRQGGVGQHGRVARHERECVPGDERGSACHRWVARLLTGQHQRCGGERCQVRRTDTAALTHRWQRVLGDHVGQRFQDRRMQAVAVGGELVEPDQQHGPHSLGRARVTRAGRVRAQQLQRLGVRIGYDEIAVRADAGRATVDRPLPATRSANSCDAATRARTSGPRVTDSLCRATATMSSRVRWLPSTMGKPTSSYDVATG